MNKNKIVLLDAHAILHRAYHALPDFSTRDGKKTGALYGVCAMLISIIKELKPQHILACYDMPKKTFRHEAFEDYKGGRKKTDEDLIEQIIESKNIFEAFGIDVYEKEGYEADDVIGTLSEILKKDKKNQVIIASGDMDTFQLIQNDDVVVYTLKKGINSTIIYNQKSILEKFGFEPKQIIDYKALAGDSSDNISGIKGVGEKTATNLILNFGSIENIYKELEKGDDNFTQKYKNGKITPRILNLIKEGESDALFSKELATIKTDVEIDFKLPKKDFLENINFQKTGELFRKYEFRVLNERLQKACGVEVLEKKEKKAELKSEDKQKVEEYKLAVSLLNPNIADPTIDDILNFSENQNLEDAFKNIAKEIKKEKMDFVWKEMEIPILDFTKQMTQRGFLVDVAKLKKYSKNFHKKAHDIEKKVYQIAGEEFNLKSTQQLSKVLFQKMNLPTTGLKKTPKGVISTKESELLKLKGKHEIIDLILEYRELVKMISTYLDNLEQMLDDQNRIHPEFLQIGTSTGRMSSRNPNIQNIPTSGEYGSKIREIFIAEKNFVLASFDYSQIELKTASLMSQDKFLLKAFKDQKDIHTQVAKDIFGEETKESRRKAKVINFGILYGMGVNALRKNINSSGDEISLKEAKEYLENYFAKYSGLYEFMQKIKKDVSEKGYTETLFGRRRYFPEINSKNAFLKAMAERTAQNAPIQGTATGDIVKLAMKEIKNYLEKNNLKNDVFLLAQVHDELIFEITENKKDEISKEIQNIMENILFKQKLADKYKMLLKTDVSFGKNWGELK
ncbi:hypothetical protein CSB11_00740 [Candidatus Campbellbacteria bacterium]|nr:MAG: hypothetical protein CSB11_00740 [Candidatus Campbellbacteria bacterium]